jgi:hypothetical protein
MDPDPGGPIQYGSASTTRVAGKEKVALCGGGGDLVSE